MYCDLHIHSYFSDGSLSPSQIVTLAKQQDLIVALTDHNTVAGLDEFITQAQAQGVTAVPGIELSTDDQGVELHLLGLFIKPEHYDDLENLTHSFRVQKEESNRELARRLQAAGYAIDYEQIRQNSPEGTVNRAHFAAALCQKGYVSSISEAFERLLKPGQGFYCPPKRLDFIEAVKFLSERDILPIWAHPLKDRNESQIRAILPQAKQVGLVGLETWHSSYHKEQTRVAASLAQEYGLLPSGGSDFHGDNKPGISLNCCRIPASVYDDLKK